MKEYLMGVKLDKGLRQYRYNQPNSPGLESCYNLVPMYGKLVGLSPIQDPFEGTVAVDWPFPQLFILEQGMLLCTRTKIYSVDSEWSLTEIGTATTGGLWSLVDAYDFIVLSNGVQMFSGSCPCADLTEITDQPIGSSMCYHKGEVYLGAPNDKGDFFVSISKIGNLDFTHDISNTAGSRPISVRGEVLDLKPLGDSVIIYGTNGIAALVPTVGPPPAYVSHRLIQLASYGIPSKGSVGGDGTVHLFIDSSGIARTLTPDLKITELGYQEFFETMLTSEPIVNFDPILSHFYISDGTTGFILTPYGLGQISQLPTTVTRYGDILGVYDSAASDKPFLVTDWIDMKTRGRKAINAAMFSGQTKETSPTRISFYVSNDLAEGNYLTPSYLLNPRGEVMSKATGTKFKARIDFDIDVEEECSFLGHEVVEAEYLQIRWGLSEKSFIRGTYANEINIG